MMRKIICFLADNWVGVVISMVLALFVFWAFGFMSNALFSTKFELSSCWAGVAAISTAGVVSLGKYWTDSKHNSPVSEMPNRGDKNDI
ncbi:hypothetical protein [Pelosinus sp. IPA-1]|uniref:hypothetical protein n=1 Tax=Pelosinus sp. IPA-1 TaxID=3029569 RepID=UPI00243617A0|nr:hypothetical protein [Pelosinus sp. IPA-1]GMB00248.1 hypothetical protein PIPA1_30470 [Pelosinus sp. IPA-1]